MQKQFTIAELPDPLLLYIIGIYPLAVKIKWFPLNIDNIGKDDWKGQRILTTRRDLLHPIGGRPQFCALSSTKMKGQPLRSIATTLLISKSA